MEGRRVLRFKDFVLEEGEVWDALCHGVGTGVKAYKQKRKEQDTRSETKKLSQQILSAEGTELKKLVKKIVDNGYSIKDGKVVSPPKAKPVSKEVFECINTKMELA